MSSPNPASSTPAAGLRVGVDLVATQAVAQSIANFGDRYLQRIFTAGELADSTTEQGEPSTLKLAARFAAKEATLKVLRPAHRWYDWRSIEVRKVGSGWTELQLHGEAALQAEAQGLHSFSLSLSHECEYAIAVVIGSA